MNRVVVTGMGVLSPVGNTLNTFWANITAGICGIGPITRFDTQDYKVKIAAEVRGFDPLSVMDRSEARRTDLYAQYAMAAAVQAMESSGLTDYDEERLGVYVGSGIGGIQTFAGECEKLQDNGPRKVSPYFVPMMISNMAAGQIAIRFHARGPSLPVVTACATGSHAVGEAYRAIRGGYADAILAGGAEAAVTPMAVAGFTSCMALSTTNEPLASSLPFDRRRDGFVIGEGAGVLLLEEYGHARARGARIWGEIVGYGNTCDAYHITAPRPDGADAARAIALAVAEAGIGPEETLYINAHGTGTPLNDSTETMAIKRALGPQAFRAAVSSTKSMTGHMLGAAGAVEAIVSLLALEYGVLPPTTGYREPDEACDLDYIPNTARSAAVDAALSVSLGFGGHNACLAFRRAGRSEP